MNNLMETEIEPGNTATKMRTFPPKENDKFFREMGEKIFKENEMFSET